MPGYLLEVIGQAGTEGNRRHSVQPLAVPTANPYQPVPAIASDSGPSWAQGYLRGWTELSRALNPSAAPRPTDPTLVPQSLQPLVLDWFHRQSFDGVPYLSQWCEGWLDGWRAACDAAFGAGGVK